jgi:hypothetical protein
MWRWIRHWRDWAMNEIVTPRRLMSQPQGMYYRFEKAGLTIDQQPVPWTAEVVVVEALLRLPPSARKRTDFTIQIPGMAEPVAAELLRAEENGPRHRLFFRLPVPKENCSAALFWKRHILGRVEIHVISAEQFLNGLQLHLPSAFVALGGASVAASTFVSNQQQGLIASALVRSTTGLAPLLDYGLTATFKTARATKTFETAVPLSASQLMGREAIVTAIPPKLPKKAGEWSVTWSCQGKELAVTRLKAVSPRSFQESLRVCDTRFGIVSKAGIFRITRQLPTEDLAKVGPCFLVSSREVGMAGLADFEIGLQMASGEAPPPRTQTVLITDGPTPVTTSMLSLAEVKSATAFELRLKGKVLGVLPLSAIPIATFTAEGAYKPPPDFAWSAAAEDELSERLARLMGSPVEH